jgi:hypothetical protein
MRRRALALLALAIACGPVVGTNDDDTTSTDPTTTTTAPDTSASDPTNITLSTTSATTDPATTDPTTTDPTTASTTTDPTTTDPTTTYDPTDSCGDYIGCPDYPPPDCSLWGQDCTRGSKCMPWADDGGPHWNAAHCTPLDPNPASLGDPCIVEGSYASGIDNCDLASMCLFVDPNTNEGVCVPFCTGNEDTPVCDDPQNQCVIDFDDAIIACLPTCDPLAADCARGGCYATNNNSFACVPTIGDGAPAGEQCTYRWDCAPGTACIGSDDLAACQGTSCCAPFCDLALPEPCELGVCSPWFADGEAPPGLEQVGVCVAG